MVICVSSADTPQFSSVKACLDVQEPGECHARSASMQPLQHCWMIKSKMAMGIVRQGCKGIMTIKPRFPLSVHTFKRSSKEWLIL